MTRTGQTPSAILCGRERSRRLGPCLERAAEGGARDAAVPGDPLGDVCVAVDTAIGPVLAALAAARTA
jgi:hypothetical protein